MFCAYNWRGDMAETVRQLDPFRWEAFQVLLVKGENDAVERDVILSTRKRNARKLLISDNQFEAFCDKHRHLECFVPEPNSLMASSYLIVDEYLCFLDKGADVEKQSRSILDVGVLEALGEIHRDQKAFKRRGGVYEWTKDAVGEAEVGGGCGLADNEGWE